MLNRVKLAGAALIIFGFLGMTPSGDAAASEQFHVVEHATTDMTSHVGPKSDNLGDILTFANEVFDAADSKKIGTDQGFCVRVMLGKAFECQWTLTIAGGQIVVQGPFFDARDSVLAVTGGTGKYRGARGQMALHARDSKGSAYDFFYTLVSD